MKKIVIVFIVVFLSILGVGGYIGYNKYVERKNEQLKQQELERIAKEKENLKNEIISHYNKYVTTEKDITLYQKDNEEYKEIGVVGKEAVIELNEIEIDENTMYFPIATLNNYYVSYKDVIKTDKSLSQRYKNYIPFNENIITLDTTNLYNDDGKLIYTINTSLDLPILIKKYKKYGVEYNNQLLFVEKDKIKSTKTSQNTTKKNTSKIAVLNYHFFYDDSKEEERKACNQNLCFPTSVFQKHIDYIKENNFFTPTLSEFEMYLDKKIQLPKSVVITIDDGWRRELGLEMLDKNQLNVAMFLITKPYKEITFLNDSEYIEYHSHGDNLHNQGECSGANGGAITCKSRSYLLNDLKTSRSKLNNTTYFCYPFYEYNNYAISVLKEAGFTMAFGGGNRSAYIGVDKFKVPRYSIAKATSVADIAKYLNN